MKATEYWKNFQLGDELSIAGAFIYNGMRRFHEMRSFSFADEVFEVLYNLSVGIERLLKIAVVLVEHDDARDQAELESSLITHNHLELLARLKKRAKLNLGTPHNDLLALLGTFYKSLRYDRFTLASSYNPKAENEALVVFLEKHLSVAISRDSMFGMRNEDRYRAFLRKTVLKICRDLYELLGNRATELNLYTYELQYGSKASSVFQREVDMGDEDVLWKELLIFFMNSEKTSGYIEFLRGIEPLDFDPEMTGDYLDSFRSDAAKGEAMDELEHHYEELGKEKRKERLEMMKIIGAPGVYFGGADEEDESTKGK
jgi:hypothetical protein